MDNKERIKKTEEVTKELEKLEQKENLEDLVKDNKYEFDVGNIKYKVKKPTHSDRQEIQKKRIEKFAEFARDDRYLFEDQWIEIYQKKGIDLNKLSAELLGINKKHEELLLRLNNKTSKEDIKTLEKEIIDVRVQQSELIEKRTNLLQYSIESQVNDEINLFSVYVLLEKKVGNNWEKAYKTYEEFLKDDNEELALKGSYYLTLLLWR